MNLSVSVTLLATVLAVEGEMVRIDRGAGHGLAPGDRGVVFYTLSVNTEPRKVEVGLGDVVAVQPEEATVRLTRGALARPGYALRFDVPPRRLSGDRLLALVEGNGANGEASPWAGLLVAARADLEAQAERLSAELAEAREAHRALDVERRDLAARSETERTRLLGEVNTLQGGLGQAGEDLVAARTALEAARQEGAELGQQVEDLRREAERQGHWVGELEGEVRSARQAATELEASVGEARQSIEELEATRRRLGDDLAAERSARRTAEASLEVEAAARKELESELARARDDEEAARDRLSTLQREAAVRTAEKAVAQSDSEAARQELREQLAKFQDESRRARDLEARSRALAGALERREAELLRAEASLAELERRKEALELEVQGGSREPSEGAAAGSAAPPLAGLLLAGVVGGTLGWLVGRRPALALGRGAPGPATTSTGLGATEAGEERPAAPSFLEELRERERALGEAPTDGARPDEGGDTTG